MRLLCKTFTESVQHFDHHTAFFKGYTFISTRFKIT
jgi:hypothetical protein